MHIRQITPPTGAIVPSHYVFPTTYVHHPRIPGRQSTEAPGQKPFSPQRFGAPGYRKPPGSSHQRQSGPPELQGNIILQRAVSSSKQSLKIGQTQEFRTIPWQVPPGRTPQVQGAPGHAGYTMIISDRLHLEGESYLGRQAQDTQVAGRGRRKLR
jgi:hypothetical protein